jgi:hypothetical protein
MREAKPKRNHNKQLRLRTEEADEINSLVEASGLSESDVLRLALKEGLKSLKENPLFKRPPATD